MELRRILHGTDSVARYTPGVAADAVGFALAVAAPQAPKAGFDNPLFEMTDAADRPVPVLLAVSVVPARVEENLAFQCAVVARRFGPAEPLVVAVDPANAASVPPPSVDLDKLTPRKAVAGSPLVHLPMLAMHDHQLLLRFAEDVADVAAAVRLVPLAASVVTASIAPWISAGEAGARTVAASSAPGGAYK